MAPGLTVRTPTESEVSYELIKHDSNTNIIVAGYEVLRFGVPMIGEYMNAGTRGMATEKISPTVPGAQYKISAWALGRMGSSATAAVEYVTAVEASESN